MPKAEVNGEGYHGWLIWAYRPFGTVFQSISFNAFCGVGHGPAVLAVCAVGGCFDIFISSPRRSPGRAIVLPPASALALAKC